MLCPQCQSESCRRSRRQGLRDFLISAVGLRPWRCRSCEHRFAAWSVPIKYLSYVHCARCGNLDLQRISSEYVEGAFVWLFRMMGLPSYRCAPCRHRFFSLLRYHRIVPAAPAIPEHQQRDAPAAD